MTKEELTGLYCSYFQASVDYLILTIELNKKIEDETVQDLYVSTGKCKELASRIQLILRKDHNIQSAIDYCNIANLERLRSLKIQ